MPGIKNRLYQFYELVAASGITEFQKAITTFKNWQKEILSSFAFGFIMVILRALTTRRKLLKGMPLDFEDLIVSVCEYYCITSIST